MTRIVLYMCLGLALAASASARNRIVGGTAIDIEQVPFAVALHAFFDDGTHIQYGGGVVLTSRHVLSTAHSFPFGENFPVIFARLGSSFWQSGGVDVVIQTAINHPEYDSATDDFDVTVLVLSVAVPIGPGTGIANAVLPHPSTTLPAGTPISVAGWGQTETQVSNPQLLNIDIYVIDRELCHDRFINGVFPRPVTSNMFCAGILDVGGPDACGGDSGGPAYVNEIVYGLVSWGPLACGHPLMPGVYTNIAPFTLWIADKVKSS